MGRKLVSFLLIMLMVGFVAICAIKAFYLPTLVESDASTTNTSITPPANQYILEDPEPLEDQQDVVTEHSETEQRQQLENLVDLLSEEIEEN